jgi:outer membrane protein TolC
MIKIFFRVGFTVLGIIATHAAIAAQNEKAKLPNTLTLEYALSLADEPHPQLMLREADVRQAQAEQAIVDTDTDTEVNIEGRLRYVEPPDPFSNLSHNDSNIGITITKQIYDFGLQEARSKSAQAAVSASQNAFLDARSQRRLLIMERFFDVILADLQYNRYNEEMAVEYVSFDRLRKKKEAGEVSDYQVKKQESRYQQIRYLRVTAENAQRRTRALLADALNHPGELPNELAKPDLAVLKRKIPDYDDMLALAMQHNYKLKALREKLEAAQQNVAAARDSNNTKLYGELEAYDYARNNLGTYDKYRAGIYLKIPLFNGGRTDAQVAKAQAQLYNIRAQLEDTQSLVRQRLLDTWLQLQSLEARRQEMKVLRDYRDLNLDRSRALYEMEVTADLGDAMVQITEAEYLSTQADYQMAEAWMRLDILTGQLKLAQTNLNP